MLLAEGWWDTSIPNKQCYQMTMEYWSHATHQFIWLWCRQKVPYSSFLIFMAWSLSCDIKRAKAGQKRLISPTLDNPVLLASEEILWNPHHMSSSDITNGFVDNGVRDDVNTSFSIHQSPQKFIYRKIR